MECILCWITRNEIFGRKHFKKSLLFASLSILIWKIFSWKRLKQSTDQRNQLEFQLKDELEDKLNVREALFFRNEGKDCFKHIRKEDFDCEFGRVCPARNLQ